MTTKELTFTEKIIKAQSELKAPKGQYNNFGKYKYRSAEDILEAVKPINAKYGLLLTLTDSIEFIGDRFYVLAKASLTDGENFHYVTAYAREEENKKGMDGSQITGTASSYARKYALNGLYLIDDTKDADTDEYATQQKEQPKKQNQEESKERSPEELEQDFKQFVKQQYNILERNLDLTTEQVNHALAGKLGIGTGELKQFLSNSNNYQTVAQVLLTMSKNAKMNSKRGDWVG